MSDVISVLPVFDFEFLTGIVADLIRNTLPNDTFDVIALMGPHGIGKSEWGANLSRALEIPFVVETMSGKEPTDIIGLPYESVDNNERITKLAPPSWFHSIRDSNSSMDLIPTNAVKKMKDFLGLIPPDRKPARVLMLDEYNRGPPDTFGPMMNKILTQTHQGEKMRVRTLILLAGNINKNKTDEYNINQLDPAQRDRIREIEIKPTLEGWRQVVEDQVHPGIIRYVVNNKAMINAFSDKGVLSLRTLTRLGRRLKHMEPEVIRTKGTSIVSLFVPIHLSDAVSGEVLNSLNNVSVTDVLYRYSMVKERLVKNVSRSDTTITNTIAEQILELIQSYDSIISSAKEELKTDNIETIIETVSENLKDFMIDAPKPTVVMMGKAFVYDCKTNPIIKAFWPKVAKSKKMHALLNQLKQVTPTASEIPF